MVVVDWWWLLRGLMALRRVVGFGLGGVDLRLVATARRSGRVRGAIGLVVEALVGTNLCSEGWGV